MIVVDANVIVALVKEGSLTSVARAVYAADADWIVPSLWQSEVLNALLNEVKAGNVTLGGALEAADMAASLLRDRIRDCGASAILTTAHTSKLTAYDATYVVLARTLGLLLITEDKLILRTCPDVARSMRHFLTPPQSPPAVREEAATYRSHRAGKRGKA
jgi:predicted nucleic acid-binding protein